MARERMIVVANRLPVRRVGAGDDARWEESPGGLVSAMRLVMRGVEGVWVGWTGQAGGAPSPFMHDAMHIHPVSLSRGEIEAYYHGMSNATFWPLYHDAIRPPEFQRSWWDHYVKVNSRFAQAAADEAAAGDLVWVHDYHLQLVPRMLRRLRPDVRIGFFLHIPFPPSELFEWLPWRQQTLEGLLGADVVGFQTPQGSQNFARLCRQHTRTTGSDTLLRHDGREITVGAFPISIDAGWYEHTASLPRVRAKALDIRRRIGPGRRIILGVDRLDYTKGIDLRLRALEQLLRTKGATAEDCLLMQVAVPSRETIKAYSDIRDSIEGLVGRINGQFGVPGRAPVSYFRRNLSREDLVAYYVAADVMLVTPLRDGMNLVAKEYVATRLDDSGVLVLSEFTGAARQLDKALLVNPRDVDRTAEAIHRALTMPEDEAKARMRSLRSAVRKSDVFAWANGFVEQLRGEVESADGPVVSRGRRVEAEPAGA